MKRCIAWLLAAVFLAGCASAGLSVRAEAAGAPGRALARFTIGGGAEKDEADGGETAIGRGTVTGTTYENAGLDLGCTLDESWIFSSEEGLAAMSEPSGEETDASDVVWDMFAVRDDGMAMVGIDFEGLGELTEILPDESGYIDAYISGSSDGLGELGLTDGTMEKITVAFAGGERYAIRISGKLMGVMDLYQTLVCIRVGDTMIFVLLESLGEDITDQLAGCFHALA